MLSSDIDEACSGAGREQVPASNGLLSQLTQVECRTQGQTQIATDTTMLPTEGEPDWDEVVEEWLSHGTEFMIF